VLLRGLAEVIACKLCVAAKGLNKDSPHLFGEQDAFWRHLRDDHDIGVGDRWSDEIAITVNFDNSMGDKIAVRFERPLSERLDRWTEAVEWAVSNKRQDVANILMIQSAFMIGGSAVDAYMRYLVDRAPHDVHRYWHGHCNCMGVAN
jgi:hypothetical protein